MNAEKEIHLKYNTILGDKHYIILLFLHASNVIMALILIVFSRTSAHNNKMNKLQKPQTLFGPSAAEMREFL